MKKALDIYILKISYLAFMLDVVLMGSGHWSDIIGVSIRKTCFSALCISSVFIWIRKKMMTKNELYAVFFIMIFLALWTIVIPLINNTDLVNSILDSQLIYGMIFLPAIASSVVYAIDWQRYKNIIYFFSLILALIHIAFGVIEKIIPGAGSEITAFSRFILEPMNIDDKTSVYIGYVGDDFRVMWGSSVLLLVGYYLLYKTENISAKKKYSLYSLFYISIAFTNSRGLLLAIVFMHLFMLANRHLIYKIKFNLVTLLLLGTMLAIITFPIVLMSDPEFLLAIRIGRDISDDLRYDQMRPLLSAFLDNLFWGKGFGASVDVVRSEAMPWSYELSILALYMKCGMIGVFLLIICFVFLCLTEDIYHASPSVRVNLYDIYALLFSLIFSSNTNPYLFNLIGFAIILFLYVEYRSVFRIRKPLPA